MDAVFSCSDGVEVPSRAPSGGQRGGLASTRPGDTGRRFNHHRIFCLLQESLVCSDTCNMSTLLSCVWVYGCDDNVRFRPRKSPSRAKRGIKRGDGYAVEVVVVAAAARSARSARMVAGAPRGTPGSARWRWVQAPLPLCRATPFIHEGRRALRGAPRSTLVFEPARFLQYVLCGDRRRRRARRRVTATRPARDVERPVRSRLP